jgi:hypothetical protein
MFQMVDESLAREEGFEGEGEPTCSGRRSIYISWELNGIANISPVPASLLQATPRVVHPGTPRLTFIHTKVEKHIPAWPL